MLIISLILSGYKRLALSDINYFEFTPKSKIQLILGSNGSGKAQPLDAFIKTPQGWDLMGNMKVGTDVIAKDGSTTKVIAIHPQGKKEIFKVTFSDGRSTEVTGDHLWKIYIGAKKYPIEPRVITTLEVIKWLQTKTYHNVLWVDLIDHEKDKDIELPVDPYLLGVILGDGCSMGSVVITNPDQFIHDKVSSKLKHGLITSLRNTKDDHCLTYGLSTDGKQGPNSNYIVNYFNNCDLMYKKSYKKFIPEIYLNASSKQRLELLQGLMDTDGTIDAQGTSSYSSSSEQLALQVTYLVRSLGGIAFISIKYPYFTYKGVKKAGAVNYQVNIRYKKPSELFTLPRKKERTNDNNQYAATLKLRIHDVQSIGFKEAQCISIEHPDQLYVTDNFIVTHNSSVIKELSPLPAIHTEFEKDGYKIITIEKDGSLYILKSIFGSGGNKYNFIKDDEELNIGGTVTVYKELVKKYFNITQEVHDLLIGNNNFHTMSVAERRSWFTRISDVDYTFAIEYYNNLKEQQRDIVGGIKLNQSRLIQESTKLLTTEVEKEYRQDIIDLNLFLKFLLDNKPNQLSDKRTIDSHLVSIDDELSKLSNVIKSKLPFLSDKEFQSLEELDLFIINAQTNLNINLANIQQLSEVFQSKTETCELLERSNIESYTDIDSDVANKTNKINSLIDSLIIKITIKDPVNSLLAFETIKSNLSDIVLNLRPNSEKIYTRDKITESSEKVAFLTTKKKSLEDHLTKLLAADKELTHLKEHSQTECPKCEHRWYVNYNEIEHIRIKNLLDDTSNQLTNVLEEITKINIYLEEAREYSNSYKLYSNIVSAWPILNSFWEHVLNSELIFKDPTSVSNLINKFYLDLHSHVEIEKITKELNDLILLKETLFKNQELSAGNLKNDLIELNLELIKKQNNVSYIKSKLSKYLLHKKIINELVNPQNRLVTLLESRTKKTEELISIARRDTINEIIQTVQIDISKKEQIISRINVQKALVENLENQILDLTEKSEVYKVVLKELSPSEGLIAKSMSGFINHFVNQINSFIKKIWLYPLELIPVTSNNPDEFDLDFKFNVKVNDNLIISDVSKGSSAMKEVIDLAFRIVSMRYLNLTHAPIVLDEFASKLDHAHRQSAFYVITNLITSSDFSQIFMVSHYSESYGSLKNTDVTILCPSNIVIPKDAVLNKNTIMK